MKQISCPTCGHLIAVAAESRKVSYYLCQKCGGKVAVKKTDFFQRLFGSKQAHKGEKSRTDKESMRRGNDFHPNETPDRSKMKEYSLLQLSTSIFANTPSSTDDDQLVNQAQSLIQNSRWEEAKRVIQNGLQTCNRRDRLCELMAIIYRNQKNFLAIGWYMQSCVLGSRNWTPYLAVSYAARSLGLERISWRCLNACDVVGTGMPRTDQLETGIAYLVNNSDRSQLLRAMKNFEKEMDPYLPSSDEIPHDQMERSTFLLQNITGDPEMQPIKQRLRLMRRR